MNHVERGGGNQHHFYTLGLHCETKTKLGHGSGLQSLLSGHPHTGAGHQRTVSTNNDCNQWLSLAKTLLKMAIVGRNRSLVAHTSKCGWAIRLYRFSHYKISKVDQISLPSHQFRRGY